jgi:hypothetical protein
MDDTEKTFPLSVLLRISRPMLRILALLLILVSLWGIIKQLTMWNRSVKVVVGVAAPLQEERHEGAVRYFLPFTVEETGAEMVFWLDNGNAVLDYLATQPPTSTIALRYWPDDMSVMAVNLLLLGVEPVQYRIPPSEILLATSILGFLVALALLLPDFIYGPGRRSI